MIMDPTQPGVGYAASAGGAAWVKFDWTAKTSDPNWMPTTGLGVTDAGWISRNEDSATDGAGNFYATKNDKTAGLSDGDVIFKWDNLTSPNPTALIRKPWQAGFGQSIEFVPETLSPSGHGELWMIRGADGATNPGDGSGAVTGDWARLDLTNTAAGWTTGTITGGQTGYT
jgi:hypothetical protein